MNPFEKLLGKKPDHPYAFVPGTSVREPITGREAEYRPWEAPPRLSVDDDPEVAMHQGEVHVMHSGLIEHHLPVDLPKATLHAVITHITPRAGKEISDYQGNYERSLVLLPELELDDQELMVHHKVDIGTANMAEITANAERIGRGSAELAILRIINGHRAEYVDPMVDELKVLLGAHYSPAVPRKFRIEGLDEHYLRGEPMRSMTWGYKQHYGKLPDGTEVDSRHSFILRTDEAVDFDLQVRDVMQSAAISHSGHVPLLKRVREVLNDVAETGPSHPWVAGAVIKLYLFNREIDKRIAQRDAQLRKSEQTEATFDSTNIFYKGPQQH